MTRVSGQAKYRPLIKPRIIRDSQWNLPECQDFNFIFRFWEASTPRDEEHTLEL